MPTATQTASPQVHGVQPSGPNHIVLDFERTLCRTRRHVRPPGRVHRVGPKPDHPWGALRAVEVADLTLRYDREIKIPLYARHGIPEVWLIDADGRTLTVFETPADGRYRNERRVRPSGALAPKALPGVELDPSRLFGTA